MTTHAADPVCRPGVGEGATKQTQDRADPVTESAPIAPTGTPLGDVPESFDDAVIIESLFRWATSGRAHSVDELRAEVLMDYPEAAGEQLERCIGKLCEILMRTDYDGFATEYTREARKKRGSRVKRRA